MESLENKANNLVLIAVAYADTFHGEGFIQWHVVVICI